MYKPHAITAPLTPEPDTVIWRYMTLSKFLHLLETSALYFATAEAMHDRWEGVTTEAEKRAAISRDVADIDAHPSILNAITTSERNARRYYGISCWTQSTSESELHWYRYANISEGIAIRSTFGRLCDALVDPADVHIGRVTYKAKSDLLPGRLADRILDPIEPLLFKLDTYKHDNELRAICQASNPEELRSRGGVAVKVDLVRLVESISVAPEASAWFMKVITGIIAKYTSARVSRSDIASLPEPYAD